MIQSIHLYHRPFLRKVYLPRVYQNCFQDCGVQNWFQGLSYVSKTLWTFLLHCSLIQIKWVKYVKKTMLISCKNDAFTWLYFYLMLLICYCTPPTRFLSISFLFFHLCAYAFVLIFIMLLVYIFMFSFIMIPVRTSTMLLLWTLLSQNTNLAISWKIPILMNWAISYIPIDRKRTLYLLWSRVTFKCMLSYFNVGGRQIVFIIYLVIF